jgi:AcrR family transcriptional regulator
MAAAGQPGAFMRAGLASLKSVMSTTDLLPETMKPKRRAIMAAAAELFMAEGYAAAAMDGMARAAGVSKATLYAYFTGKVALFKAIIADGGETMRWWRWACDGCASCCGRRCAPCTV